MDKYFSKVKNRVKVCHHLKPWGNAISIRLHAEDIMHNPLQPFLTNFTSVLFNLRHFNPALQHILALDDNTITFTKSWHNVQIVRREKTSRLQSIWKQLKNLQKCNETFYWKSKRIKWSKNEQIICRRCGW